MATTRQRILITNDDGIQAAGLLALRQALAPFADVVIVAPDRPRSACGHSITLHKPLRLTPTRLLDGSDAYASNGTPSDCVSLALLDVMKDAPPDLVIAGVNHGPNLGWDLTYSGTVSAAMEAAISGRPAFAISVAWRLERVVEEEEGPAPEVDYRPAASFAAWLARQVAEEGLPPHTLLNVNVPIGPLQGVQVTRQGARRYPGRVVRRQDPAGRAYYWIHGTQPEQELVPGTDVYAVARGYISVMPVQLDLTDHQLVERLQKWQFPTPG
ncbi:MAG: 5'/3'-nucleotidase SurE [Armatimonadetes bacterium]|nr:5'/3'-nucleotidase SurE [Armatimonadota bacterium]